MFDTVPAEEYEWIMGRTNNPTAAVSRPNMYGTPSEVAPLIPGADARRGGDAALALRMPEAKLWLAVLKQAVHELSHPWSSYRRRKAREWIESESEETGAFLWIATMLHLEPGPLRQQLLKTPPSGS